MSCEILGKTYFVTTNLPSDKLLINQIFAIAFNGVLIIPTILLNAIAIITILKSSQLKKKPCYFIILIQSITDLAVGALGIPIFIFFLGSEIGGISNCIAATLAFKSTTIPLGTSTITISALTLERYIAILHPYAYNIYVTRKRLLIYIVSNAAVLFAVIILSFAIQELTGIYSTIYAIIVFFFMAFAYTRIYFVVKRLARSHNKLHVAVTEENLTRMKLFLQQTKLATSCFVVVVCFCVLCLLPIAIAIPLYESVDQFEFRAILVWIFTLGMLNSNVNSVIFFWTKSTLRKEATNIKCHCDHSALFSALL